MARVFNINIDYSYGWEIDHINFKGTYDSYKDIKKAPSLLAICKQEDEKIIALYDAFVPKDEVIKEINELDIFIEECVFNHNDYSFEGSFVDALIYIQNQYIKGVKDE